ncbi:MAG: hypothetical protein [Microviridae sp.]|nr:MAG: hypothetical protein [Microviridae sp.]
MYFCLFIVILSCACFRVRVFVVYFVCACRTLLYLFMEFIMATAKDIMDTAKAVSVTHLESLYIRRALDMLVSSNDRLIKKEMPGSDVVGIRERENDMLKALSVRFGA